MERAGMFFRTVRGVKSSLPQDEIANAPRHSLVASPAQLAPLAPSCAGVAVGRIARSGKLD